MEILTSRLQAGSGSGKPVRILDQFQYAMFGLLVLMCFGDKLGEKQIREIERIQRRQLLSFPRFSVLNFWPKVGKGLFRRWWEELYQLRKDQEDILLPYIRARQQLKQEIESKQHLLATLIQTYKVYLTFYGDKGAYKVYPTFYGEIRVIILIKKIYSRNMATTSPA